MRDQILSNVRMTVIQVIVSTVSLIVVYRFLLMTVGIEQLGLWSLVVSIAAVVRVGELGISGSVVKFVAVSTSKGDIAGTIRILGTSIITVAGLVGFAIAIGYPILARVTIFLVPEWAVALELLPYVAIWLWLSTISNIFQSGLDGCNRGDQRSITNIFGSVVYVGLIVLMVPTWGLIAVVFAQIIQVFSILALSWALLRQHLNKLPIVRWPWSREYFLSLVRYGLRFQVISFTLVLLDPLTKVFLTRLGGLASTGYFEMANRMVMQFRAISVMANQVLVPVFARLNEVSDRNISDSYLTNLRVVIYVTVSYYSAVAAGIPLISLLWLGYHDVSFVTFALLMLFAWFNNNLAAPAYFASLGTGNLRWNVAGHVVMAALNVVLGVGLGFIFGSNGVVAGVCIALVVGSWTIAMGFQSQYGIPIRAMLDRGDVALIGAAIVGVLLCWTIGTYLDRSEDEDTLITLTGLAAYVLVIMIPVWRHPLRNTLVQWFGLRKWVRN